MERNFGPTSRGTRLKSWNEIPENVSSIRSPTRNFRNFGRMESALTLTYSMSGGLISAKKELKLIDVLRMNRENVKSPPLRELLRYVLEY